MEQQEWEAAIARKRAGMGRLADEMQDMTPEQCKETALARLLQTRSLLVEQTRMLADTPDAEIMERLQVPAEQAAQIMAQYREVSSEEFFERALARLRAMPAEEVKASQLAMLRRVSSEDNMPPMPSEPGAQEKS